MLFRQFTYSMVVAGILGSSIVSNAQVTYEPQGTISPARQKAALIYNRLTGKKLPIDHATIKEMEAFIVANNPMGAARRATEESSFYSTTVPLLGARISNLAGVNRVPLNDVTATVLGFTKDDLDAREILSSNFLYRFQGLPGMGTNAVNITNDILRSNNHYQGVDNLFNTNPNIDLRPGLVRYNQVIANNNATAANPDPAGILSSRAFLSDCSDAGTNRRCYQKVVTNLTCHTLEEVANSGLPDDWIGRDVSRAPGGDPGAFQTTCKSCHSNMDGQRVAFAYLDFGNDQVRHGQVNQDGVFANNTRVANKINQLGDGRFEPGRVAIDNSWVNYAVGGEFDRIYGWRDANGARISMPVRSTGLNAYGRMIARSEAFSRCMTQQVFEALCRRKVTREEKDGMIRTLASEWETSGQYKFRWLFERVAVTAACVGQ